MLEEKPPPHNGVMPQRAGPNLPPGVGQAAQVLGSPVRVAILASLAADGPATRAELERRIDGVSHANLQVHIDVLEQRGVVLPRPPRDTDPGPVKRIYSVDLPLLDRLLATLRTALIPAAPGTRTTTTER